MVMVVVMVVGIQLSEMISDMMRVREAQNLCYATMVGFQKQGRLLL